MKHYTHNGTDIREETCPPGHVIIDEYHPCRTVTPWDYYGMCHQREYSRVLCEFNPVSLRTTMTILHPRGTGPGGSVRFGDNMTPGIYRLAVPTEYESAARAALNAHQASIQAWLNNKGSMPEACRG